MYTSKNQDESLPMRWRVAGECSKDLSTKHKNRGKTFYCLLTWQKEGVRKGYQYDCVFCIHTHLGRTADQIIPPRLEHEVSLDRSIVLSGIGHHHHHQTYHPAM